MLPAIDRCVVHEFAHFLGKKSTILFLEELKHHQPIGFNQLSRRLELIPKTVSERLKEMEESGLAQKDADEKYVLTPKGMDACEVVAAIKLFEMKWKLVPETCNETNCVDCKWTQLKQLPDSRPQNL
ncbi:MAG: helix-turn-helix transcriptional regulator [Candidatus Iainarchaeum archaeon]|uniref:Helix-turn-helix transcriptional regulator n=1 Tax=Candidatus Iainarchaeum sp. TaxID=3101447 RepID=A0A7T9DKQ2_9ARCH|nr:MAG: helix-turn-helix transcriptional regulator [Candidatus Diapherotrites archaeon]